MSESDRIVKVEIDPQSLSAAGPDAAHERRVAIYDLIEDNFFQVVDHELGPYVLKLSMVEQKLVFEVTNEAGDPVKTLILSLMPLRRVIKDYFAICQSYHEAIRTASPQQIEAIDMGRRGLHNEGSELLDHRLKGKIVTDFDTSRRLFTLVCALHQKGGRV
ncbi:MAG: hypothetical protein CME88_02695 [Hirschia sp.]|nr:hypothetical protein [Hirschia sp.]MBF17271.1 hypothetical protein [Hirschia sp.]